MNRPLRLLGIVGIGTLVALFALLSASGAMAHGPAGVKHVTITDTGFRPVKVNVGEDDTVVWTNDGRQSHTVTGKAGLFNSGPLAPGQTFSFTFNKLGIFSYHDAEHTALTGRVDVDEEEEERSESQSATATATPLATPTPAATAQAAPVMALLTSTSTPVASSKVQPKPAQLPRTGEGEPDIRSYVLLAALLILALGFGLRSMLARARR